MMKRQEFASTPATQPARADGQPKKFDPDEIFQRIDRIRQSFEPEPSLLAQLFSPNDRRHAEAIATARVSAIKARQALIDGLADCIRTYVSVHRADLQVRGDAFVLDTFARLVRSLNVTVEDAFMGFLETFSDIVMRIEAVPNLTPEMKQGQKTQAWERAQDGIRTSKARFERLLDELSDQVERLMGEIGK